MRVLSVAAVLVDNVFRNVQANMAAGARRINMRILCTNRSLHSIHSESVSRSMSTEGAYSYAEKNLKVVLSIKLSAWRFVNPLPNDKILDLFKMKVFADDILNVTENLTFLFDRVENIVGKGERLPAFSPFPTMFSKCLL